MKAWNSITIVGVGLIGGSVGLAARSREVAGRIIGTGSRQATLAKAREVGAIDEAVADPAAAVADAELVVVCAPVDEIVPCVEKLAPHCQPGTLITDAGSTKLEIVTQLDRAATSNSWPTEVRFVGSHPLAGNEKQGPAHATADLFAGRIVVITPGQGARAADVERVSEFWKALGAKVVQMLAVQHDRALAATSHLPHLVAAAIAASTPEEYVTLTASGWQDTTRIASGDPVLWRQIMLSNRPQLLAAVDRFAALLAQWREALAAGDAAAVERLLAEAKHIRDAVGS
jgi:prephenate dehydrogenase